MNSGKQKLFAFSFIKFITYSLFFITVMVASSTIVFAAKSVEPAITEAIPILQIKGFNNYSKTIQSLINEAYRLSKMNLTYMYGSHDPKNGGMDCSGTIYHLLTIMKIKDVPRDADGMFSWTEKNGTLNRVTHQDFNSPDFSKLHPGDLLFWSGTYHGKGESGISHVMLFLGKNNQDELLMFGSSNGRTYQGKKMWGVSVFDFKLPNGKTPAKFVGYSCIPQLTCDENKVSN